MSWQYNVLVLLDYLLLMKKILSFTAGLFLLVSCADDKPKEKHNMDDSGNSFRTTEEQERVTDTVFSEAPFVYDTLLSENTVHLADTSSFSLKITTYSLNDKAFQRRLLGHEGVHIERFHTRVSRFSFQKDTLMMERQISKEVFKEYIHPTVYQQCDLVSSEFTGVKGNEACFSTDLSMNGADLHWIVRYCYPIYGDSLGEFHFVDLKKSGK